MALVSDLLKLLREAREPLTMPELARLTGASRKLIQAALEELARLGKLQKVTTDCGQGSCPLSEKCSGCHNYDKLEPDLVCPFTWRLTERKAGD
jgi:cytochrome c2